MLPASRRETLFVDTNLLLVLIVGALDRTQIERFKRTRAYSPDDYTLLAAYVGGFQRMVTTPNVLTEVSNLLGQLAEPLRRRALLTLGLLTGEFQELPAERRPRHRSPLSDSRPLRHVHPSHGRRRRYGPHR